MVWGPATLATESMVIVVPAADTPVALMMAMVALPSTLKCTDAFRRLNVVSGAAGVPAVPVPVTVSVPALTLAVLMPPPAAMLPRTVPLVTLSVPATRDGFALAAAVASTMLG